MNAIWWENLEVASTFLGKYNLPFRKNIDIEPAFTFRSHSIVPLKKWLYNFVRYKAGECTPNISLNI